MAETKIEWADYTFNPWEGCHKVSPGCKNCYAADRDAWLHRGAHWGPEAERLAHKESYWAKPLAWQAKAAKAGEMKLVFCGSLCDILEAGSHLDALRARAFSLVPQTPNIMWLFLTKRPENALTLFPKEWLEYWPANAMFGFTAENQEWLEKRWGHWNTFHRQVVGLCTFISAEPLLGPLAFGPGLVAGGIDWVIAGGESGDNARPMHPDWVRSVRDQCQAAKVPFLFKQWGEWLHMTQQERSREFPRIVADGANGCPPGGYPEGRVYRWPDGSESYLAGKSNAGRLLDGREWSEFPRVDAEKEGIKHSD